MLNKKDVLLESLDDLSRFASNDFIVDICVDIKIGQRLRWKGMYESEYVTQLITSRHTFLQGWMTFR